MTTLPLGTPLHLQDGRTGKVAGVTPWGQYEVQPDNPTPDEVERKLKFLIDFERAVLVKDQVPGPASQTPATPPAALPFTG